MAVGNSTRALKERSKLTKDTKRWQSLSWVTISSGEECAKSNDMEESSSAGTCSSLLVFLGLLPPFFPLFFAGMPITANCEGCAVKADHGCHKKARKEADFGHWGLSFRSCSFRSTISTSSSHSAKGMSRLHSVRTFENWWAGCTQLEVTDKRFAGLFTDKKFGERCTWLGVGSVAPL